MPSDNAFQPLQAPNASYNISLRDARRFARTLENLGFGRAVLWCNAGIGYAGQHAFGRVSLEELAPLQVPEDLPINLQVRIGDGQPDLSESGNDHQVTFLRQKFANGGVNGAIALLRAIKNGDSIYDFGMLVINTPALYAAVEAKLREIA